jgi:hypothetical protein
MLAEPFWAADGAPTMRREQQTAAPNAARVRIARQQRRGTASCSKYSPWQAAAGLRGRVNQPLQDRRQFDA